MDPYNGYSGKERDKKYHEYKRLRELGLSVPETGPCRLYGDPSVPVEPHSEDYSHPYLWNPPAEYMICRSCHGWIHKRFGKPETWKQFKSHVRRGGYAKEFSSAAVQKERAACSAALEQEVAFEWRHIHGREVRNGMDWWEHLTLSKDSLTASWTRPRL